MLRGEHLTRPAAVAAAYGAIVASLVKVIAAHNTQITELEAVLTDHFSQHPGADGHPSLRCLAKPPQPERFCPVC